MKRFLVMIIVLALMLTSAACGAKGPEETAQNTEELEAMEAKLATIYPANHPMGMTAKYFADLVAERTDGKFKINIYYSEQLGSMPEAFDSLELGMIEFDMAPFSEPAKRWAPAGIVESPYIFESREHCIKFINDKAFDIIVNGLTDNVGVTPLGTFYAGTRHMTTSKTPFTTPEELRNAKLKIRASGVYTTAAIELMGATATPMALSEVYIGLQNGTVDGQENPATTILSNKFYEVQDYLIKTGHIVQPQAIFVNSKYFASLPEAYQSVIRECAQEAAEYANELFIEQEDNAIKELEEKGMTIIEADIDAFIEVAADYHKENIKSWGQELYDAIAALR